VKSFRLNRRFIVVGGVGAALVFSGSALTWAVTVPNPDPCDAKYSASGTDTQRIDKLRNYMDCRADRIEKSIPTIPVQGPAPTVTVTGPTTTVPGPTTTVTNTVTASPSATPPPAAEPSLNGAPALIEGGFEIVYDTGDNSGGSLTIQPRPGPVGLITAKGAPANCSAPSISIVTCSGSSRMNNDIDIHIPSGMLIALTLSDSNGNRTVTYTVDPPYTTAVKVAN
jgi:hypothetical protein